MRSGNETTQTPREEKGSGVTSPNSWGSSKGMERPMKSQNSVYWNNVEQVLQLNLLLYWQIYYNYKASKLPQAQRFWTCGTRLFLLVWAGWGLGMTLTWTLFSTSHIVWWWLHVSNCQWWREKWSVPGGVLVHKADKTELVRPLPYQTAHHPITCCPVLLLSSDIVIAKQPDRPSLLICKRIIAMVSVQQSVGGAWPSFQLLMWLNKWLLIYWLI